MTALVASHPTEEVSLFPSQLCILGMAVSGDNSDILFHCLLLAVVTGVEGGCGH